MKASNFFFALIFLARCRSFDMKTAPGFLELKNASGDYVYRATTPEGVVIAARVETVEGEGSDSLAFWTRALTLQLRDQNGYALLDSHDVQSLDGLPGKQLRFGHDENGKPYAYWVTFWAHDHRVTIVETGGAKSKFDEAAPSIEWMLKSVRPP
jgi:hypothetical protein